MRNRQSSDAKFIAAKLLHRGDRENQKDYEKQKLGHFEWRFRLRGSRQGRRLLE